MGVLEVSNLLAGVHNLIWRELLGLHGTAKELPEAQRLDEV